MSKSIVVFGGDGFCGWPTSLYLSSHGYDITIIDNLSRRKIDVEMGCNSLTPIVPIQDRIDAWHELTGNRIQYENIDLSEHYHLFRLSPPT